MAVTAGEVAPGGAPSPHGSAHLVTGPRVAAAIVAGQALVYGSLAWRGYFYVDDLDNMAAAARTGLSWDYLTLPLNDHLTPGLRLGYWLLAHLAPYQHGASVLARVAVQAVATVLFYRLLLRLFGPRPAVLTALAGYAFCPLMLPSFLSLSSAVNLLPAHVGLILLLDSHVRYAATGRLRYAVIGALALLGGVLFWEKAALGVVLPPLLTAFVLVQGGWRARVGAVLRQWRGLGLYVLPVVLFVGYYVGAGYPTSGRSTSVGTVLELAGTSWLRAVGAAAAGGPWSWHWTESVYFGIGDPPLAAVLLGQLVLLGLAVLGVRSRGPVSLLCWTMPVLYLLGGSAILAVGRYPYFGDLVATNFHYLSDLTVPLVLAAAAAVLPVDQAGLARRASASLPDLLRPDGPARAVPIGRARVAGAVVLVAAVSLAVTAASFQRRWTANPTRDYLGTLVAELRAHPGTNLYDTPLSSRVLPVTSANRRPSQVLAPLDVPVTYDDPTVPLKTIDERGRVVDAVFVPAAASREDLRVFCSHLVRGDTPMTVRLAGTVPAGDHVVQVDYLMERGAAVRFRVGDGSRLADPVGGGTRQLRAGLHRVILHVSGAAVDRIEVYGADPDLNLCVAHIDVGSPQPAGGG